MASQYGLHLSHDLDVNAFFVALAAASQQLPDQGLYHWVGQDSLRRSYQEEGGELAPDGWGRYLTPAGEVMFSLEWDLGTESPKRLVAKAGAYVSYFAEHSGAELNHILFVGPGPVREQSIRAAIGRASTQTDGSVRFWTTHTHLLRERGPPRTVLNPQDITLLGGERIVAKQRRGARGSGKAVLPTTAPDRDHASYDLYQQFIPDRSEYRVSVLSGHVVSAYVKSRPEGAATDDLHPDWRYERASVLPRAVVTAAREAAQRVGLDYAGVDVVEDRSSGRVYCLEANAAPGMSEETVRSLYAHLQQALRGRAARAS